MGIFDNATSVYIGNKEVQSITVNQTNAVLYQKSGATPVSSDSLEFAQSTYTASNGACTISCTLTMNGTVASNETVTLTGTDGSDYSATTDSNGVATFILIGKGNITYTASSNNLSDSCLVNGMDNKIQIMKPTCSRQSQRITSGNTYYYRYKLTWTVKDENDDPVPNVTGKFYYSRIQKSGASTTYSYTTHVTDSNGQYTYTYTSSNGSTYPSYSCAANGSSAGRPSVTGNWKYKSYTYS